MIGGADGPTVLYLHKDGEPEIHEAYSAVSDTPRGAVEWGMIFREAPCADLTLKLLR